MAVLAPKHDMRKASSTVYKPITCNMTTWLQQACIAVYAYITNTQKIASQKSIHTVKNTTPVEKNQPMIFLRKRSDWPLLLYADLL